MYMHVNAIWPLKFRLEERRILQLPRVKLHANINRKLNCVQERIYDVSKSVCKLTRIVSTGLPHHTDQE